MYAQVIIPLLNVLDREEQVKIFEWLKKVLEDSTNKARVESEDEKYIQDVMLKMHLKPKRKL